MNYEKIHLKSKRFEIQGRYLNLKMIESILNALNNKYKLQVLGYSVQNRPVYKCEIGTGKIKILMWSQMHGNESTTTKGLFDFMNFLEEDSQEASIILKQYSFCILPMLNPDGAEIYTRVNANEIDLNRDFQNLSQPESQLLMQCYEDFKPDYCYNLHDQRTIFGVGTTGQPATVSFLAPSYDEKKEFDAARMKSVAVIMKMVRVVEDLIPGQIGRFDDGFNNNCVGDRFQSLKTPTILIEAGHFPKDFEREETRKYIFIALLAAFLPVNETDVLDDLKDYSAIPQNLPNFFDILYKNVSIIKEGENLITDFAIQYKELLANNQISFSALISKIGELDSFFGHEVYDAQQKLFSDYGSSIPKLGMKANFYLDNNVKVVNGLVKK